MLLCLLFTYSNYTAQCSLGDCKLDLISIYTFLFLVLIGFLYLGLLVRGMYCHLILSYSWFFLLFRVHLFSPSTCVFFLLNYYTDDHYFFFVWLFDVLGLNIKYGSLKRI